MSEQQVETMATKVMELAKQFCEADIEYTKVSKDILKGRRGLGPIDRWERKRNERHIMAPISHKRRAALNEMKRILCGWTPSKPGGGGE